MNEINTCCPVCSSRRITVTDIAEVHFSATFEDGVFTGETKEDAIPSSRQICKCSESECGHIWEPDTLIDISSIKQPERGIGDIVDFECIHCQQPRTLIINSGNMNFNPNKDQCINCSLGLS
ncbi:hypothetical protein [Vibrio sp. D431a]|uniref:hypothetical protein n=1 Tax=Vibrio sp. D431a TaxID=2837388 RepID=UPI0025571145|nr:hypothetical protein [Vibrio sp. D431a]MDK9793342.1 hypothetical protein [Vibrio sp. D431a]